MTKSTVTLAHQKEGLYDWEVGFHFKAGDKGQEVKSRSVAENLSQKKNDFFFSCSLDAPPSGVILTMFPKTRLLSLMSLYFPKKLGRRIKIQWKHKENPSNSICVGLKMVSLCWGVFSWHTGGLLETQ